MAGYNKHAVLAYLFDKKTDCGKKHKNEDIYFTLKEVREAIGATGGTAPSSISNFVLDLTRKKSPIEKRVPQEVIKYGYDLRKTTGRVPGKKRENYCGVFVYRGFDAEGNTIPLDDWLAWEEPDRTISVENKVPELVQTYIANDEASLFSVVDYCGILSQALGREVYLVQSPMKWQPNEIDGFYVAEDRRNVYVYPVEAKAISTDDDINLVQMYGQYRTLIEKYQKRFKNLLVRPIAAKMEKAGMLLAVLEHNSMYNPETNKTAPMFNIRETIRVVLDPPLEAWQSPKRRGK